MENGTANFADLSPRIRSLGPNDLPQVTAIYAHYVMTGVATFDAVAPDVEAWSVKAGGIVARGLPFLVAEIDEQVVGFAYASAWRPKPAYRHTVESTIYVAPALERRGLGRLLMEGVIGGCRKAGMEQMIAVIADTGNPASEALHRSLGFVEAGRLSKVGYKHERWIDTALLQLSL